MVSSHGNSFSVYKVSKFGHREYGSQPLSEVSTCKVNKLVFFNNTTAKFFFGRFTVYCYGHLYIVVLKCGYFGNSILNFIEGSLVIFIQDELAKRGCRRTVLLNKFSQVINRASNRCNLFRPVGVDPLLYHLYFVRIWIWMHAFITQYMSYIRYLLSLKRHLSGFNSRFTSRHLSKMHFSFLFCLALPFEHTMIKV